MHSMRVNWTSRYAKNTYKPSSPRLESTKIDTVAGQQSQRSYLSGEMQSLEKMMTQGEIACSEVQD
jgi:hypothetical protein